MIVYESKKNPLEYYLINQLEEGNMHCHKEYEIIACISGKVKANVNKKEMIITEGELLIVFPYQLHTYKNIEDGKYRLFIFSPEYLIGAKNLSCNDNIYRYSEDAQVCDILCALDKKYNVQEKYSEMLLVGYINVLMHKLIFAMDMDSYSGSLNVEQRFIEYCVKNCDKKISLPSVSADFHMSSAKLSKILKNYFGLSFPNFISSLRINNACILLKNTDLSITQISSEVGFESIRNFNRVFINIMGETPKDYRKKQQK